MSVKFKPGDKVKRVEEVDDITYDQGMRVGGEYTVVSCDGEKLDLEEVPGFSFCAPYFTLVEKKEDKEEPLTLRDRIAIAAMADSKQVDELTKEVISKISDTIDDAARLYGENWDNALVLGEPNYHAITSEHTQDIVVRTADDSLHTSWLCDYLEAVSPANIRLLLLQCELVSNPYKLPTAPKVKPGDFPVMPDGWVKCSDRLPEHNQEILAVVDGCQMQVRYVEENPLYEYESPCFIASYDGEPVKPTHWIPLPNPPLSNL